MKLRHVLALALLPVAAACSKPSSEQPPPAPATTAETASAPAERPPAEAAASSSPQPEAAGTPAPAPVPVTPPATSPLATEQAAKPDSSTLPTDLVAGKDYELITDGKPFDPAAGKIEVAEVFNYACPACNSFNPQLQAWKAKLGADVKLTYVPAEFRPDFLLYAKSFFAAQSLGLVDKTHEDVYLAIHDSHTLPGEGSKPDEGKVAAFYAKYGANAADFQQLMDSFAVNVQVAKARQFTLKSRVQSTPSLVIDGKYLVKGAKWEDYFRVADQLIAKERAH